MILLLPNSSNQNPSLRDFVPWKEWSMNKILGSWNSGLMISFCRCWGHEVELRHFAGCCSNFPPWRSQSCRLSALIVAHSSMQPTGAWDLPWGLPVLASQLHVLRLKGAAGVNIWIRPFLVPTEPARMSRPPICGVSGLLYPPIFIDPLCPARDRWYGGDWNAWMIQVELLKWQEFPLFSICLFTK